MFSQTNYHCQQFYNMEAQFIQQPGEPINYYPPNPELCPYENRFQSNQPCVYSEPEQYSGNRGLEEAEESEAVDELLQILVESLKKTDVKTREVLLRKCFIQIEKEMPLERFLVERIKHSRIASLLEINNNIQQFSDMGVIRNKNVFATRELDRRNISSSSQKLARFKVRTVQVGDIVKEESN